VGFLISVVGFVDRQSQDDLRDLLVLLFAKLQQLIEQTVDIVNHPEMLNIRARRRRM